MGNKKKLIKDIIKNFDFEKVEIVMDALNWRWATSSEKGIPNRKELIDTAKYCLKSAYKQAKEHAREDLPYHSGTGGFNATAACNKYGKVDFLKLEFVVSEWEAF